MEGCWKIKEERPIKLTAVAHLSTNGGYCYVIKSEPMTMTYKTCDELDMSHNHQEIQVSGRSYSYKDGEAEFLAQSKEDLDKWVEKYSDIIVLR